MSMSSRSSRVEPLEIRDILQGTRQNSASPVEHVSSPSSPVPSAGSVGRSVATEAANGLALRTNRFSTSFPVQPSPSMSPTRTTRSPVREAYVAPETVISPTGPTDTNFLTAVAAQERRVLELKEELIRAEADLNKLKEQWQHHEAQKKRNDARSVTKLQPLQSPLPDADNSEDSDGSNVWMQQEMERRKVLLSGSKSSNRTVFSGSRHTRTLSLLTPANRGNAVASSDQRQAVRPPRKDSLSESARRSHESEARKPRPVPIARASTVSDMMVDGTRSAPTSNELAEADSENDIILLQTGKKMATGLRDGIWTFWEDLRQATVGDEATLIQPPHGQSSTQKHPATSKQSSKTAMRPPSRGSSSSKTSADSKRSSPTRKHKKSATMSLLSTPALADPSFWTEHGVITERIATTPVKKSTARSKRTDTPPKASAEDATENDAWDAWDESSPRPSCGSSAASEATTLASTISSATSPRVSAEIDAVQDEQADKADPRSPVTVKKIKSTLQGASPGKDPIPWPALSNLGPKALRRTASHLMSEWEKSLTPSPTKEHSGQQDYLGLGADATTATMPAERKVN